LKQMRVNKVRILGHNDPSLSFRVHDDLFVDCSVSVRQFQSVHNIATRIGEPIDHSPRQLGIDEKLHGPTV